MRSFNAFLGGVKAGQAAQQRRQSAFNEEMTYDPAQAVPVFGARQRAAKRAQTSRPQAARSRGAVGRGAPQASRNVFTGLDTAQREEVQAGLTRKSQIVAALSALPAEQQAIGIQTYGKDFGIDAATLQQAAGNPATALATFASSLRNAETLLEQSRSDNLESQSLAYGHLRESGVDTSVTLMAQPAEERGPAANRQNYDARTPLSREAKFGTNSKAVRSAGVENHPPANNTVNLSNREPVYAYGDGDTTIDPQTGLRVPVRPGQRIDPHETAYLAAVENGMNLKLAGLLWGTKTFINNTTDALDYVVDNWDDIDAAMTIYHQQLEDGERDLITDLIRSAEQAGTSVMNDILEFERLQKIDADRADFFAGQKVGESGIAIGAFGKGLQISGKVVTSDRAIDAAKRLPRDVTGAKTLPSLQKLRPMPKHIFDGHVGKSQKFLQRRLDTERIPAASTFSSLKSARKLTNSVLDSRAGRKEINKFINEDIPVNRLVLHSDELGLTFNNPTGSILHRGTKKLIPTYNVTVVIHRAPLMPEEFRIVTSYND